MITGYEMKEEHNEREGTRNVAQTTHTSRLHVRPRREPDVETRRPLAAIAPLSPTRDASPEKSPWKSFETFSRAPFAPNLLRPFPPGSTEYFLIRPQRSLSEKP